MTLRTTDRGLPVGERADDRRERVGLLGRQAMTTVELHVRRVGEHREHLGRGGRNFASCVPVTSRTGTRSSGRRSHIGSMGPVPSTRSWCAIAAPSDGRVSSVPGGRVANMGWASQRTRNASAPSCSASRASCSSASIRAAARGRGP